MPHTLADWSPPACHLLSFDWISAARCIVSEMNRPRAAHVEKRHAKILPERAVKEVNVSSSLNLEQWRLCCFQYGKERNACTNTQFALIISVNKQACRLSKSRVSAANCIHAVTLNRCWFCISKKEERKSFSSLDRDLYDFCCKSCWKYQSWIKHCWTTKKRQIVAWLHFLLVCLSNCWS